MSSRTETAFTPAAPMREGPPSFGAAPATTKPASRWLPAVLALAFALTGLRTIHTGNIADTDAARHAMNGAFVHDMVWEGEFTNPVDFGKRYYSRLPAVSIPYHPPLFPVVEAGFFSVFGVNLVAARLTVMAACAASALLFYYLILATHRSQALAALATIAFFSWRWSQWLANDVMLEIPAMAFILGALYCLRDLDKGYPLRTGLAFAALASAAVWTKQQAVFLGAVPFAYAFFSRRWRLLAGKTIWFSSAIFGASVFALTLLSAQFRWTGVDQVARADNAFRIFVRNMGYYARGTTAEVGWIGSLLVAAAFLYYWLWPRRREPENAANDLYLAWAATGVGLLLFLGPYDLRYFYFGFPALFVVGLSFLFRWSQAALPRRRAWLVPAAAVASLAIAHARTPMPHLTGPAEAARAVMSQKPDRVLFCGWTNGSFIFAVRALDPERRTAVIRGDKLPAKLFEPEQFERFANHLGIRYIVLEQFGRPWPWDSLRRNPSRSMVLEREIPQLSWEGHVNGTLRIYRFTNPSPQPEDTFRMQVNKIGGELVVHLR